MPVLDRIFATDGDVSTFRDPAEWLFESMGAFRSASGIRVTPQKALSLSAYLACQRVISEDTAKLPLIVYRRLDRGKERAPEHPAYPIVHDQPNPDMSSMAFRETLTHHAMGWGNGYAEIQRVGAGGVHAMWPIHPSRVEMVRNQDGAWVYRVWSDDGGYYVLEPDRMFHIHGMGFDGRTGYSIARMAAESLGVAIATQQFGGRFFSNGLNIGGVYQTDKKLSDTGYQRLRKSMEDVHAGVDNAHKAMILEEGLKFAKTTIPPDEAQWLETRQFQVEDICRWHRVSPHKVQHLLRSTFNNIEHLGLEHVTDTLMPWEVRWEQEIQRKIIRDPNYFAEHLNDALLRGDTMSRYQAHNLSITGGWGTRNEARIKENMNPLPGLDEPLEPVAIAKAPESKSDDQKPESDEPPAKPAKKRKDEEDAEAATIELRRKAFARVFADAAQRLLNKEQNAVARAEKKHGHNTPAMAEWAREFLQEHGTECYNAMLPLASAFIENETAQPLLASTAKAMTMKLMLWANDHLGESAAIIEQHGASHESWKVTRAPQIATALIERLSKCQATN